MNADHEALVARKTGEFLDQDIAVAYREGRDTLTVALTLQTWATVSRALSRYGIDLVGDVSLDDLERRVGALQEAEARLGSAGGAA